MKIALSIFLFSCLGTLVCAQTDTLYLSLDQAVQYSLLHRFDVKSDSLNTEIAANKNRQYIKEWLPDINGTANLRYNIQLQETVVPAGYSGNTNAQKVAFGTRNNTSFSLDLSQPIFKPGIVSDIKISDNAVILEQEKNNQTKSTIALNVEAAYLTVLLKNLQVSIAHNNEERHRFYFELSEHKYVLGTNLESDYLTAKLDYENSCIKSAKARREYERSIAVLRYELNLSSEQTFILTDSLNRSGLSSYETKSSQPDIFNYSSMKQLSLTQRENILYLQKARSNAIPSLYLLANYTMLFQSNRFDYIQTAWTPYNYVALKLSIPITSNFKNSNTIQQYKLRVKQTEFDLSQKKKAIQNEVEENEATRIYARETLISTRSAYELSQQLYKRNLEEYKLGTKEYSALLDTEEALKTAEENYLNAVYEYLSAELEIKYNQDIF